MRHREMTHRRAGGSEINMTPMLDVVFILLIFFIVTASFIKESGIRVSGLESGTTRAVSRNKNIMVSINALGQVWIDKRRVDLGAVRANIERMHAENPQAKIFINADKESANGVLVVVMDYARLAGIYDISLVEND